MLAALVEAHLGLDRAEITTQADLIQKYKMHGIAQNHIMVEALETAATASLVTITQQAAVDLVDSVCMEQLIQHVSQQGHHRHHHHRHRHLLLADVHFYTHTQSIEALAVAKQPLQLLHAVKLLFVAVLHLLRHLLLHLQPLIAVLALATEALVEPTVMEFGV